LLEQNKEQNIPNLNAFPVQARMMELWKNVKFVAYDLPQSKKPYEERMKELDNMFTNLDGSPNNPVIRVAPRRLCESKEHLMKALEEVSNRGGEGIILRQSGSYYVPGPSEAMREVKVRKSHLSSFFWRNTYPMVFSLLERRMSSLSNVSNAIEA